MEVALFARAWIETGGTMNAVEVNDVALFARAWIETAALMRAEFIRGRRPLREGVD